MYSSTNNISKRFHSLFSSHDKINITELSKLLEDCGFINSDPRLCDLFTYLHQVQSKQHLEVPIEKIKNIKGIASILDKVLCGQLIIPDFPALTQKITEIFEQTKKNTSGNLANYIPQLSKVDPDKFGLSICTVDGQCFSLGDATDKFALQSVSKPITYAMALEEHGEAYVHQHVGKEPSGMAFNELSLTKKGLPHNPMINAGAIMSSSLIRQDLSIIERFEAVMKTWAKLTTGQMPRLNQGMFFSEKETADRNYAICYLMREKGVFAHQVNIQSIINLYFQCCSLELTCNELAIASATLANSGLNPLINEQVFTVETVKNTLSLMSTCGMYDFSGEFFFTVGVPSKSGVSGALMVVIPNVLGMAIYSPRLDSFGNSSRGIEFCKRLVKTFNFHVFDGLTRFSDKIDPTRRDLEMDLEKSILLCAAASRNSVVELKRLALSNVDLDIAGYDGRTALHHAAFAGANDVIKYLIRKKVRLNSVDHWGNTPLDEAIKEQHLETVQLLKEALNQSSYA